VGGRGAVPAVLVMRDMIWAVAVGFWWTLIALLLWTEGRIP